MFFAKLFIFLFEVAKLSDVGEVSDVGVVLGVLEGAGVAFS